MLFLRKGGWSDVRFLSDSSGPWISEGVIDPEQTLGAKMCCMLVRREAEKAVVN